MGRGVRELAPEQSPSWRMGESCASVGAASLLVLSLKIGLTSPLTIHKDGPPHRQLAGKKGGGSHQRWVPAGLTACNILDLCCVVLYSSPPLYKSNTDGNEEALWPPGSVGWSVVPNTERLQVQYSVRTHT